MNDALATARSLAAQGLRSTTALLGEHLHDPAQVEATVAEYVRLLEALEREGLEGGVSVKPTHVGLSIDAGAVPGVARAAGRGGGAARPVPPHRHGGPHHDRRHARDPPRPAARHDNVGIVLQAYLKRTLDDIDALPPDSSVRLCKGIYVEPPRAWWSAATTRCAPTTCARSSACSRAAPGPRSRPTTSG